MYDASRKAYGAGVSEDKGKEKKKKKNTWSRAKNKTEKGLCNPTSVTSSLRETYSCVSVLFGITNGKKRQS